MYVCTYVHTHIFIIDIDKNPYNDENYEHS